MKELIKQLTEAYGPPGYEDAVRDIIQEQVGPLADNIEIDPLGNLHAVKAGAGDGIRIMLAAHMARALYGEPRLVVLDEPNANLDAEGEEALVRTLNDLKQSGVTVVVVAHRPSLLANVDMLLVLKDGVAEMFGPRAEVIARVTRSMPPVRGAA